MCDTYIHTIHRTYQLPCEQRRRWTRAGTCNELLFLALELSQQSSYHLLTFILLTISASCYIVFICVTLSSCDCFRVAGFQLLELLSIKAPDTELSELMRL